MTGLDLDPKEWHDTCEIRACKSRAAHILEVDGEIVAVCEQHEQELRLRQQYCSAYGPYVPADYALGDQVKAANVQGKVIWMELPQR